MHARGETLQLTLRFAQLGFDLEVRGDVASDPFDGDDAPVTIEHGYPAVFGADDPSVRMHPTDPDRELQSGRIVLKRLHDDVAIVRMDARQGECRIRVERVGRVSGDRDARRVDVVVAPR